MQSTTLPTQLAAIRQNSVLRFENELDPPQRQKLEAQLQALDLNLINHLTETYVRHKPQIALPRNIQPAIAFPQHPDPANVSLYKQARQAGLQLVRDGKVAAFLVAGGQGTPSATTDPRANTPSPQSSPNPSSRSSPNNSSPGRATPAARFPGTS